MRAAHHAEAFPGAVAAASRRVACGIGVSDIRGDEQIQASIAVEVEERASRIPARAGRRQSTSACDIAERAIAVVAIENLIAVESHEQVDLAVVVVVAGADALSPA